jgi:hypothetical protein
MASGFQALRRRAEDFKHSVEPFPVVDAVEVALDASTRTATSRP